MDSSSPSTSACDSSDCSDARNGEGLVVDEIMRIKEKRLRLLHDYRNGQEESILPLMREADEINRKKKKKTNGQFHAENNTSLRRSERILTQTLNENRTLESPMHQPLLERDPISERQHEPESEPEPILMDESEPEPESSEESEPEPMLMDEYVPESESSEESEPEPILMDESEPEPESPEESEPEPESPEESEPEPILMDEYEPESESSEESEPEPILMDESEPEPESPEESEPEPILMDESEPEPESSEESEPEPILMDESEPEPESPEESEPEPILMDESEPEPESSEESEAELVSTDDSEPELVPRDEPDQQALPRRRRVIRRARSPRLHRALRHVDDPVPVPSWRYRAGNEEDNWYGEKQGFEIGYQWSTRLECSHDKVHRPSIAGIHPGPHGAYSVALSGVYPEDLDRGNVVIFTGAGGRDLRDSNGRSRSVRNAPQVRDQELNKANLSLIRSVKTGNPVRLIRGYKLRSSYAPERGYRYDGLYRVVRFWYGLGYSGFRVFRFKMYRLENQQPAPWVTPRLNANPFGGPPQPPREPTPPPRDPTPPPRDPTPPPRDPTPPPRDPTPPPNVAAEAMVEDEDVYDSISDIEELDNEIQECIRALSREPEYIFEIAVEDSPYRFRGWYIS